MSVQERKQLVIAGEACAEPVVGRWLGALQDARKRTHEKIAGLDPGAVDWPQPDENSIGSILYHIALIEADWLFAEVLEIPDYEPEIAALFPYPVRDAQGRLTEVRGIALADHLDRLERVRARLLQTFRAMDLADFQQARALPAYDVTPEWVLHHLLQHEAEHRSQLGALRERAERASRKQSSAA